MKRSAVLSILIVIVLATAALAAKTVFVDGNRATGERGTLVTSTFLNSVNNHRHDGKATDGSGVLDYYQDTGSANNLVIAPSPALAAHVTGMPIYVRIAAANTGATTVTLGGLAATALKRGDGSAMQGGEMSTGLLVIITYDGSAYRLIAPPTGASTNQLNTIVARDGSGNFSAGTITANLTGTASKASTLLNDSYWMQFHYVGQGGQPSLLWGTNDGTHQYVYNPSNFSVNYAALAGGVPWTGITSKPTTVSGYGITDMSSQTAGAVPWTGITSKPTTVSGYGITDMSLQTVAAAASASDSAKLNGKLWVLIADTYKNMGGNSTDWTIQLRAGGAHHMYRFSAYTDIAVEQSKPGTGALGVWIEQRWAGMNDLLVISNNDSNSHTVYYRVEVWE